jgi:hypothetical protein
MRQYSRAYELLGMDYVLRLTGQLINRR